MALIQPFRGIRYNQALIKDIGPVLAQPYDVIGPEEQEQYYRESPYNVIRLEYGKTYPSDHETENRYSRAAESFNLWLDKKIIAVDEQKNYYFHEQSFTCQNKPYKRFGFMAAVKLEPYSSRTVLPHELTMANMKADRLQLLQYTRTNISPVFTVFPDPENRMAAYMQAVRAQEPILETVDSHGQGHRLWAVSDQKLLSDLTTYLARQPLLIADGHHRYETALNYRDQADLHQLPGAGFILSTLVSLRDPGLLMLPTHRLIYNMDKKQAKQLDCSINEEFDSLDFGPARDMDPDEFLTALDRIGREKRGFGFINAERALLLAPKTAPGSNTLPLNILHDCLLEPVLGIGKNLKDNNGRLGFSHELSSVLDAVLSGEADAAFMIGRMSGHEVIARTRRGLRLPQKSTYFYPKLPCGLALYNMELSCRESCLCCSGS